jgi:hypothetical protein
VIQPLLDLGDIRFIGKRVSRCRCADRMHAYLPKVMPDTRNTWDYISMAYPSTSIEGVSVSGIEIFATAGASNSFCVASPGAADW